MQDYLNLLRQRPQYRRLWLAQLVSFLGDWFNTVAIVALIVEYTESGVAVGMLFLARAIPPFIMGPIAGVVADRFDRKAIMIGSDVLRALIVIGFLFVNSAEFVWVLYALSVAQFVVSAFFEPARNAILPSLVEHDELITANTLSTTTWSAMLTLGAVVGGITTALLGMRTALIIDSLTFLLSAWLVWQIKGEFTPVKRDGSAHSGWKDLVDGFTYAIQFPIVAGVVLVKGLTQIGSVDVMSAIYAERIFTIGEGGSLSYGLLLAAHGLGAILGPLMANRFFENNTRGLLRGVLIGFILMPISWLIIGIAPTLLVAILGMLLRGLGGSINWTYSSILLQILVPDRFLGRIFALDFAIFTLALSFGTWLTGLGVDQLSVGPKGVAIIMAIGSIPAVFLWMLFLRSKITREHLQLEASPAHPG